MTSADAATPHQPRCDSSRMRDVALAALADAKGEQVRVLDVRQLTDITDYMIIATGASDRHAATLAERVIEQMRAAGWRPLGLEGMEPPNAREGARDWVLVDFVDVVVHIMRAHARERYDLEILWDESLSALLTAQSRAAES